MATVDGPIQSRSLVLCARPIVVELVPRRGTRQPGFTRSSGGCPRDTALQSIDENEGVGRDCRQLSSGSETSPVEGGIPGGMVGQQRLPKSARLLSGHAGRAPNNKDTGDASGRKVAQGSDGHRTHAQPRRINGRALATTFSLAPQFRAKVERIALKTALEARSWKSPELLRQMVVRLHSENEESAREVLS